MGWRWVPLRILRTVVSFSPKDLENGLPLAPLILKSHTRVMQAWKWTAVVFYAAHHSLFFPSHSLSLNYLIRLYLEACLGSHAFQLKLLLVF